MFSANIIGGNNEVINEKNSYFKVKVILLIIGIILFFIMLIIFFRIGYIIGEYNGYKQGQVDYGDGKIIYEKKIITEQKELIIKIKK